MKKTQNRILIPPLGVRGLLYVMLVMFASCKSCKKEINLLPPETQEGKNTFGCLVDGKAWMPDPGGSGAIGSKPIVGGYRSALPPVYFNATNVWLDAYKDNETISFYIRNVNQVGTYPLNFNTQPKPTSLYPQNYGGYMNYYTGSSDFYMTNTAYTGSVEITRADSVNRIVSGRFSFTAFDSRTGKTIKVTDGRFDLNSNTQ